MSQTAGDGEETYPSTWKIANKVLQLTNVISQFRCFAGLLSLYGSVLFSLWERDSGYTHSIQESNRQQSWLDDGRSSLGRCSVTEQIKRNDANFLAAGYDRQAVARKLTT